MRTRSSSNLPVESPHSPSTSNPKRRNRRRSKQPFILEESLIDSMVDQCTMAELRRAPTEGYAEAIVVLPILAEQIELKHSLINMMTSDQFFELEKDNPYDHIRWLNKITSTIKTTNLRNEISNFQQLFDESFHEAWDRYKDLLPACPHRGFTKLHQLDTFYNALNPADQDSLNSAAGGNLLEKRTQDVLTIIKNKSKCLATGGNTLLKLQDNIQEYVAAAAVNYNQGHLPSKTIANPKGELKAITTRSDIVLDGTFKMIKALLSNKEKLLELANTPFNENCSATAHALIDVHREEMILRDGDEILTLNMRHDTSNYSNQQGGNDIIKKLLDLDSTKDLHPPHNVNPLSGRTTSSSPNQLLEEFADELTLITFPPRNDDLPFDIESDHKEIKYLLNNNLIKETDSILEDLIDEDNLANLNKNLFDTMPEMFIDEHALDYSSLPLYDEYDDDDLFEVKSDTEYVYNDPFDSKGKKIKESKLLIDELDLPRSSDFLPSPKYDSFLLEDFSKVNALPSTNNEDKVFNPGILIRENLSEVITHVALDKNVKKIAISHASSILKDFDPPLYELPLFKEVLGSETLLSFSSKNEEKVFKPGILTSKGVYFSLIPELSHRGYKVFKIIKILKSSMEIFLFSCGKNICILDVPCLHFYPS
uniref:Retrotransposon gag domain-containing protein n=1 Tax=Tanacetum cinerariifolium TaxID=118510 RepID=A0A6L2J236_TANCI|nr:hypothetical protein [Tanacetum cinerariifolium]